MWIFTVSLMLAITHLIAFCWKYNKRHVLFLGNGGDLSKENFSKPNECNDYGIAQ